MPHDDLLLLAEKMKDLDMKNGGPRLVMSHTIEADLLGVMEFELQYFRAVNRCKIELFRDFEWQLQDIPLAQYASVSREQ